MTILKLVVEALILIQKDNIINMNRHIPTPTTTLTIYGSYIIKSLYMNRTVYRMNESVLYIPFKVLLGYIRTATSKGMK